MRKPAKSNARRAPLPLACLVALVGLFLLYQYGRSLWHPAYLKLTGGKTTETVLIEIQKGSLDKALVEFAQVNRLVILGLKSERILEVWGASGDSAPFHIKTYPFTGYSGTLGPKLREGDGQIPEGIYKVEYLNPNSSYHLSMKLDYPNAFDRRMGAQDGRKHLGFDIFIHGKSVTIGCIPIGDRAIEELFWLVSKVGVQNVTVILSPYDMRRGFKPLEIPDIEWENELYAQVNQAIKTHLPGTFRTSSKH